MDTGMLWFDNDPRKDLVTKINLASDYYFKKYGRKPDLCFVHPEHAVRGTDQRNGGGSYAQIAWSCPTTSGWVYSPSDRNNQPDLTPGDSLGLILVGKTCESSRLLPLSYS